MNPVRLALILSNCCAVACLAQPVMSRGQQQVPVTYNECLSRAQRALATVGFTTGGAGNFAQGWKEASGAYIICNDAPGGGMVVNIVVSTIGNDAGVPGQLRQCLQAQMEKPGSPTACRSSGPPSGGGCAGISTYDLLVSKTFDWADNGRHLGTITYDRNGTAHPTWVPVVETWRLDRNGDLIKDYKAGEIVVRLTRQGQSCTFKGVRDVTSRVKDGVDTLMTAR